MIKIQNLAESMFCVERSKYVEPQLYDRLVEGGSKMWRNASSFKRSMPKGSQNHAELSRSQRMFLADTLLEDASWQPFDEDKFTAELVPGFKNPTWLMSTRDRKDDVQFHVHMSMNGGNPVPEDDAQEITMEKDPSRLYQASLITIPIQPVSDVISGAPRGSRSRCDSEYAGSRAREAAGNARVFVQAQALGSLQF